MFGSPRQTAQDPVPQYSQTPQPMYAAAPTYAVAQTPVYSPVPTPSSFGAAAAPQAGYGQPSGGGGSRSISAHAGEPGVTEVNPNPPSESRRNFRHRVVAER